MRFILIAFILTMANQTMAYCPAEKNPDCYDFSLNVQQEIAKEKRLKIQNLSGSLFDKNPWRISFPALKICQRCNLQEVSVMWTVQSFADVDFSGSNMKGFEGANVNFKNAVLKNVDFRGAKLYSANFQGADLTGVNFESADLSLADLRGAKLEGVLFKNTVLVGTLLPSTFSLPKKVAK